VAAIGLEYFIEWEFCSIVPLSAESRYQCRCTYTRGHYKLVCSGGIRPFNTHDIWGIDTVLKFGPRILRALNYW